MKKVFLFARDPGGANAIFPLVGPLRERGYDVSVYAKDVALTQLASIGIEAKDITSEIDSVDEKNIKKFLLTIKPDFVITGTSADDMTEKYLWRVAEGLEIPSFAILDQWTNYGIRFSRFGVADMAEYLQNKKNEYLPTKILVMDNVGKREAIQDGLPENRILVSGQPYFEYLRNKQFDPKILENIKKKHHISDSDYVVVFASEPIRKIYKETLRSEHFWGYDEMSTCKNLYKALAIASAEYNKKIKLIIKLHPKEGDEYYAELISRLDKNNITVVIDKDSNSQEIIEIADFVCGMSSIFLLESYLLGKPTVSVQIGLCRENPFILDRVGIVKSVLTLGELNEKVASIISGANSENGEFELIADPINRVIDNMERILCQN